MPDQWEFKLRTYDNCNCALNCGCQFNVPSADNPYPEVGEHDRVKRQ